MTRLVDMVTCAHIIFRLHRSVCETNNRQNNVRANSVVPSFFVYVCYAEAKTTQTGGQGRICHTSVRGARFPARVGCECMTSNSVCTTWLGSWCVVHLQGCASFFSELSGCFRQRCVALPSSALFCVGNKTNTTSDNYTCTVTNTRTCKISSNIGGHASLQHEQSFACNLHPAASHPESTCG